MAELAHEVAFDAVEVAEDSVHVPFDIVGLGQSEDLAHGTDQIISHFLSCEVEDELVPSDRRIASGYHDRPVGMFVIEPADSAYHLGLDPDSEQHSQRMDAVCKAGKALRKLLCVHEPVAETCCVVVPLSEPAVVQDKKLHPEVVGIFRQFQDSVLGEVEICRFPVVAEHGSLPVFPRSAHNVLVDECVHVGACGVVSAA